MNLPSAILGRNSFFCASEPPSINVGTPSIAAVKNGPGRSALPASSAITLMPRKVPACPPYCSGISSPGHPSPTSFCQKSGSCALPSAIIRRTNLVSQLSTRKRLAASHNISCSSENPKSNLLFLRCRLNAIAPDAGCLSWLSSDGFQLPLTVPHVQGRRRAGACQGATGRSAIDTTILTQPPSLTSIGLTPPGP